MAGVEGIHYESAHLDLVRQVPEVEPAIARLLELEGEHPGQYIVFHVFRDFIDCLLSRRPSQSGKEALERSFGFVERMITDGDSDTRDLVGIQIFESQSSVWFACAAKYFGPETVRQLNEWEPEWQKNWPTKFRRKKLFDYSFDYAGVAACVRSLGA